MLKRLMIVCSVLLLGVLAGLYVVTLRNETALAARIDERNSTIEALRQERDELEQMVSTFPQQEEASATEQDGEKTEEEPLLPAVESTVVPCLFAADDLFYTGDYPAIRDAGIYGVLMLRSGKLPGDNFEMSTVDFLELIRSGWSYAITVEREEGQTAEAWLAEVEAYIQRLKTRVAVVPTAFYFETNGYNGEVLDGLASLGFTDVFYHSGETIQANQSIRQICLVGYQTDLQQERMAGLNGYLGLEIWMSWDDERAEELRYDEQTFQALLQDETVHMQSLANLESNPVPAQPAGLDEEEEVQAEPAEEQENVPLTEEDVLARLEEIDDLIRQQY